MRIIHLRKELLLFLFVTTIVSSQILFSSAVTNDYIISKSEKLSALTYNDHTPILIDGNSDLLNQASIEGWSGDGSEEYPITITGYRISNPSVDGIKLWNVNCYWVISDCLIEGGAPYAYGIYLRNVSNGIVSNNIIRERDNSWPTQACENSKNRNTDQKIPISKPLPTFNAKSQ